MQNFENKKIYGCGLIWINPGMQNFEEKKNEDLATSPDIRVVVETLFFSVCLVFWVRFNRKEEGSRESIRESSQD